ncbi:AAA family ATPase [Candidatus Saccharibacteria bacterium]|nr:AAA family ATPase [Candidatus Saccharibacteria bacterium]
MSATLYLLLGYPGAGKTTSAKIIAELTNAARLSSDDVRLRLFKQPVFSQEEHDQLYEYLDSQTKKLLRKGVSVIYDANLNRHKFRADKYNICKQTGAKSVLIWVQTPIELAKTRAVSSSRKSLWPSRETPDAMFDRIACSIQTPLIDEPHIVLDGSKLTKKLIATKLGLKLND